MAQCCSWSWVMGFLLPSLWEVEVAVAVSAAALLVAAALLLLLDQTTPKSSAAAPEASRPPTDTATHHRHRHRHGHRGRSKTPAVDVQVGGTSAARETSDDDRSSAAAGSYVIKLELLSAKYLIGANLNGASDPYAVISCGEQRRFSSMVPSSRNPLWGEEFNFLVKELPAEVTITVYDWDNVCKCKVIGSVTVAILGEDKTGATWYDLDSKSGQICLSVNSTKVLPASDSFFDQRNGDELQRKIMLKKRHLAMTENSGPLQDIFELPHDEVIHHSYSCALERSFLHHGRMSISSWHLCFHSNVFSKQLTVIIPLQDIDEIKRSQHSLINPAITIFLHTGAGDHGAPISCSQNGRVRYKFTSFWHRNRTIQALETALQNYRANLEAENRVREHSHLRSGSVGVTNGKTDRIRSEEKSIAQAITFQPFINEHVLVDVTSNTFPGTPEKFFSIILGDNSMFFQKYRGARKDTNLKLSKWFVSYEYGGNVREVTFRSLCQSPLCPPDTAVTEWQHASFSKDKRNLIYETRHQAHDVPFGSYFEIHCRWSLRTTSNSTCKVDIKIGVNMKKWCILQSKIKSGATDEYRNEVCKILEAACNYVLGAESNGQGGDD